MKEVYFTDLKRSQLYYIQNPIISGNGKQMGEFSYVYESYHGVYWAVFHKVKDISEKYDSGYGIGYRQYRVDLCTFYIPEKQNILEKYLVNGVLKSITGDPCFEFY